MLAEAPTRLLMSNLRDCSSVESSLSCRSLASFTLSIDRGRLSFIVLISASMRRESSSRRELAALRSVMTVSISEMALSRRLVRCSSASFKAVVSELRVSRSANALLNCSSIAALSCSS